MEKSRLAAKQKRIQHWKEFIKAEVFRPELKQKFESTLGDYEGLLLEMWEAQEINQDLMAKASELESELVELDEQARMHSGPS